jgi:hypothetical protein
MKSISAGILIVVFGLLACLHLYWAAGGRWGLEHAAPVNEQGKKFLRTGVAACLIVAAGLVLFSIYYLVLPSGMLGSIGWIIPVIFLLRAIGDFRYVGFAKKIKSSTFAELDTRFFSPLCLVIAALGFTVKFLD